MKCGKDQRAREVFQPQTSMLQDVHANYLARGTFPWPSDQGSIELINLSIVAGSSTATKIMSQILVQWIR